MDVLYLQWELSNMDTLGTKIFVMTSEVSLFQGENNIKLFCIYSGKSLMWTPLGPKYLS